jgi:acetyltransferase-like isoleucine patch superfamily enzyme
MFHFIGHLSLFCYRASLRLGCKTFSLLVSGAFVRFGKHSVLMPPIRLSGEDRIAIGDDVFIGSNSWLQALSEDQSESTAITIGSGTRIAGACVISAVRNVTLEENVLIARSVYIADHSHRYTEAGKPILAQGLDKIKPVLIKRGAWLGQNVVICPGVSVGEGAVIGANSVVTRDVPDYCVAAGAPARIVKTFEMAARPK